MLSHSDNPTLLAVGCIIFLLLQFKQLSSTCRIIPKHCWHYWMTTHSQRDLTIQKHPAATPACAFQQVLHSFGLPHNPWWVNLNPLIMELNSNGSYVGINFLGSNLRVTRGVSSKGSIQQAWAPNDHWRCMLTERTGFCSAANTTWTVIQLIQLHLGQRKKTGETQARASAARYGISSGTPTQRVPVGSSFSAPLPKWEACNYNKAAI